MFGVWISLSVSQIVPETSSKGCRFEVLELSIFSVFGRRWCPPSRRCLVSQSRPLYFPRPVEKDYLDAALEETSSNIRNLATSQLYEPKRVYITFNTEQAQRKCLKAVETGGEYRRVEGRREGDGVWE